MKIDTIKDPTMRLIRCLDKLEDENYIYKSPFRRIHKIKSTIAVKDIYADEELEKLRDDCKVIRNLAIIDLLNSTEYVLGN